MRAVSRAWLRTVAGSYTPVYRATLCRDYQEGASPQGDRLPIVDGAVDLDGLADVYTRLSLTVPGDLWPDVRDVDSLAPYGAEIYVHAGVRYSDARVELVGLGYLRLRTLTQPDATRAGDLMITAEDRMSTVARARLLRAQAFSASTTNGTMVLALVQGALPEATVEWVDTGVRDAPIGRDVVVQEDRLGGILSVTQAHGQIARWDSRGVLKITPGLATASTPPVAELTSGRSGVLVQLGRELSDSEVVNAVVARGEGGDQVGAAYGVAVDDDPSSPTRYSGRFGPSPRFVTSSLIRSSGQANAVAQIELSRRAGLVHTLSLALSTRPELEPDDVVQVRGSGAEAGRHRLSALTIPLVPGRTMLGRTRQQSVRSAGGLL